MPKRSLDQSNTGAAVVSQTDRPVQKKARPSKEHAARPSITVTPPLTIGQTERSHEENQERAYIAASRRADRSIEARVKSAQMASEIHKKRTGKGFKISAKIVQAEEMYEEEEDDMPRSYRMLGAHLRTDSPMFNSRLNAYLANRVAMASMIADIRNDDWNQNPINKLFAEQFPNADQHAQAMSHRMSDSPMYTPVSGQGPQRSESSSGVSTSTSPSSATPLMTPITTPNFSHVDYQQSPYGAVSHDRAAVDLSSPAMSPATVDFRPHQPSPGQYQETMPTDPGMYPGSVFTAELSGDMKNLIGSHFDYNDPRTPHFLGSDGTSYMAEESMPSLKHEPHYNGCDLSAPPQDFYYQGQQPVMQGYPGFDGLESGMATPVPGGPNDWDNYMDWSGCGDAGTDQPRTR